MHAKTAPDCPAKSQYAALGPFPDGEASSRVRRVASHVIGLLNLPETGSRDHESRKEHLPNDPDDADYR